MGNLYVGIPGKEADMQGTRFLVLGTNSKFCGLLTRRLHDRNEKDEILF